MSQYNASTLHQHFFFFNDTATTEIYTLSLHDALPISQFPSKARRRLVVLHGPDREIESVINPKCLPEHEVIFSTEEGRSEEHTSELQSLAYLVCRLLLEKKKKRALTRPLAVPSRRSCV